MADLPEINTNLLQLILRLYLNEFVLGKAKHTPFDNKTGWLKFLHECLIPKTTYALKKGV